MVEWVFEGTRPWENFGNLRLAMTHSGAHPFVTDQQQVCLHFVRHQEKPFKNFYVLIKFEFARRVSEAKLNTLRLCV